MAEAWPADLYPQQMTWGCVYNSRAFTSTLSNAQQVVSYPGAYWRCALQFDMMSREKERRLTSMIGRLHGMAGKVNVPAITRTRADNIGSLVVVSAATNTLAISVSGINIEGIAFREGDYITIAGEMFEVTAEVAAADGAALVPVNKRIRSTIAPGTPIEYQNPYCEMRLTSDSFSVNLQPVVGSSSLELREAF